MQNRPLLARLDRLRKIHLSNITPQSTKWLLEAIEVPSECSVILKSEVDRNPELTLLPSNVPDLPARCLSGASKILITIREPLIRFRSDGLWNLHLRFTSAVVVRDLLLWLGVDEERTTIDSRGPVPPTELKCDKFYREMPDDFYEPLSGLKSIRRIAGTSRYAWSLPRFQVLGARNVDSESDGEVSPPAVFFPSLEEISVSFKGYGPSTFDFLSKAITDRRRSHEEAGTVDRLRAVRFEDPRANSRAADQAHVSTAPLKLLAFISLLKVATSPETTYIATTIHKLSPEILGIIFNYFMPPEWEPQRKPRNTIARVCRHWRAIVEESPVLWSSISLADDAGSILKSLIKSGALGLGFGSRPKGTGNRSDQYIPRHLIDKQKWYWRFALEHRNRWRVVNLQFMELPWSKKNPADLLQPVPTPELREFTLQVFNEEVPPTKALELFRGSLSNLRRLSLQFVPIDWSEFVAPQLIDLRLINIKHLGPTLLQLFDILFACPSLERVVIKSVRSLEDIPAPSEYHLRPIAQLDRLREIHLSNITPKSTKWLLEAIKIPPECSVYLESEVDRSPEDVLLPSNIPDLPAKCLSGLSNIVITAREPYT
ncbi:hypothetical protein FRB90_009970 [Tulasnella sp. 427]|nr:hypothetical protein FRB90_009970 [Tulasnella sp. 427]